MKHLRDNCLDVEPYDMWFLKPPYPGIFFDYSTPERIKRRVEFVSGVAIYRADSRMIRCHEGPWILP